MTARFARPSVLQVLPREKMLAKREASAHGASQFKWVHLERGWG
jgi:hypothetical protein